RQRHEPVRLRARVEPAFHGEPGGAGIAEREAGGGGVRRVVRKAALLYEDGIGRRLPVEWTAGASAVRLPSGRAVADDRVDCRLGARRGSEPGSADTLRGPRREVLNGSARFGEERRHADPPERVKLAAHLAEVQF